MTRVTFPGRILFLSADPDKVYAQLAGTDLSLEQAGPLRDDVSTDEITPLPSLVYFDERLASHPYTGFKAGDRLPIGLDAVEAGRLHRHGWRQAVRQGLVTGAQPSGREGSRHSPRHR